MLALRQGAVRRWLVTRPRVPTPTTPIIPARTAMESPLPRGSRASPTVSTPNGLLAFPLWGCDRSMAAERGARVCSDAGDPGDTGVRVGSGPRAGVAFMVGVRLLAASAEGAAAGASGSCRP